MSRTRLILAPLALLLATGCALGPAYRRPAVDLSQVVLPAAEADALSADLGWWDVVQDDPVLKDLIREAIQKNHDLRTAVARMEEARALAGITRLTPDVDLTFNSSRKRGVPSNGSSPNLAGNSFSTNLGITWELDLWGRIRRNEEATQAQYLASAEGRRAVLLSLVGDVASGYVQLQALDHKLATARRTVEVRRKALALVENRMVGGIGDKLETSQAASALATAEAAVPQLELAVHAQQNLLCLLLGRIPGMVARQPLSMATPRGLAPGLPSTLLERRPDVRQREELLKAANAQVGVATASRFPVFNLTGTLGFSSPDLDTLTSDPRRAWSIGGGLLAPVFHGGALKRQQEAAVARWEQARAAYEKAVLSALGDTSNALLGVSKSRETVKAQGRLLASLQEAEHIATLRFEGGVSPYLEVLDAQRQLFAAELSYAESVAEQHRSVIRLYLALGGGWTQPDQAPSGASHVDPKPVR